MKPHLLKLNSALAGLLVCLLSCMCLSASAQSFVPASDPRLAYVGRVSFAHRAYAAFTYPGVQVHAVFHGTSVSMKTKPGSGFFMVEIDDRKPFKVESTRKDSIVRLAYGLNDKAHRLTITYANEGLVLRPRFYGLCLDRGKTLGARPELPVRSVEFVGNSITCGYGNEGDGTEKKHTYSKQNQFYTYAAIACRELKAQCWVVARSGIGIYRNTNGNPNGDEKNMQAYYPFTLFATEGERWDFRRHQPDVVCVNLGTNDTTLPSYSTQLLAEAYKRFLHTLRSHYPKARIVLLTGTMVNGRRLADIQHAQQSALDDARKRGDRNVFRFDFTPADGSLGYGIHKHPSLRQHEQMARELVPFLRRITGWN